MAKIQNENIEKVKLAEKENKPAAVESSTKEEVIAENVNINDDEDESLNDEEDDYDSADDDEFVEDNEDDNESDLDYQTLLSIVILNWSDPESD